MNTEAFLSAYHQSRNGTGQFHFNPLYRTFKYSEGVKKCAEAGCYWLLDILGTEMPGVFKDKNPRGCYFMTVLVTVSSQGAAISASFPSDIGHAYVRHIEHTDLPMGTWGFFITDEGPRGFFCILPTEY